MRVAIVRFPGSLDHDSARRAVERLGGAVAPAWHADPELPAGTSAVLLPGGFSYGDHLRCGAIASRAPIMAAVRRHAEDGGRVIGICNGFQVLCEAGLLPGALRRNATLSFVCRQMDLEVTDAGTPWTAGLPAGSSLSIPIKNNEGAWYGDAVRGAGGAALRTGQPAGLHRPGGRRGERRRERDGPDAPSRGGL